MNTRSQIKFIRTLILVIAILASNLSHSQIYYGTPQGINNAMMIDALRESIESVMSGIRSKQQIETELLNVRKEFWLQAKKGQVSDNLTERYMKLLNDKDFYFLTMDVLNGFYSDYESLSGKVSGIGDLWSLLTGGPIDGGIPNYCIKEYISWVEGTLGSGKDLFSSENELHAAYLEKRNIYEFFINNPYSPLEQSDPKACVQAIQIFCNGSDFEKSNIYYEDLKKMVSDEQIIAGIKEFESANKKSLVNFIKNYDYDSKLSLAVWEFEYHCSSGTPFSYALYLIRRKHNCSWKLAKEIHNNRIKRYGEKNMKEKTEEMYNYRNSTDYECVGSPNKMFNISYRNPQGVSQNYDCIANAIGQEALWFDLYDLSSDFRNNSSPTNETFLNKENLIGNIEKLEIIDDDLLARAIDIHIKFGEQLFRADDRYANNVKNIASYYPRFNEFESYTSLLQGFSTIRNDYKTLFILSLQQNNFRDKKLSSIVKAENLYKELIKTYDENVLIENFKEEYKQLFPPAFYERNSAYGSAFYYLTKDIKKLSEKHLIIDSTSFYTKRVLSEYIEENPKSNIPAQNKFSKEVLHGKWYLHKENPDFNTYYLFEDNQKYTQLSISKHKNRKDIIRERTWKYSNDLHTLEVLIVGGGGVQLENKYFIIWIDENNFIGFLFDSRTGKVSSKYPRKYSREK